MHITILSTLTKYIKLHNGMFSTISLIKNKAQFFTFIQFNNVDTMISQNIARFKAWHENMVRKENALKLYIIKNKLNN